MMLKQYLMALLGACLLSGQALAGISLPGPLVETDWVASNLDNVVVLDVQKTVKPGMSHIKGAVLVPWKRVRGAKNEDGMDLIKMLPSKESFSKLMQDTGVNNDSTVIITSSAMDTSSTYLGTRLYWQLKYYGHDEVALLNGGNAKWAAEKRPMSTDAPNIAKGNFSSKTERSELLATTGEVEKAMAAGKAQLIDARSEDQYLGMFYKKKYVYGAGHLPGAKSANGDIFLSHGKIKTFHAPETIDKALQAKGIDPMGDSINFCNSGHLASGLWFIQYELLGNKQAKLYDGSMHAWTKDKNRPVVTMKVE